MKNYMYTYIENIFFITVDAGKVIFKSYKIE